MQRPLTSPRRPLLLRGLPRPYDRAWLRGDVLAGLTVAAYLVPQVMAYAGVAGLPPIAGLWAAVPALLAYAALGSSRQLSVGPESSTALLAATIIAPMAAGDSGRYAQLAATLALLVGGFCVLAWVARLGFVADLLSRPVLVGYLVGLAAVMVAGQLERTTGVPVTGEAFLGQVRSFSSGIGSLRWPTVAVAAGTLALLLALQRLSPRLPGSLIAVLLATVAVWAFSLDAHGVSVIGALPGGLPPLPHLPDPADLRQLLLPAVGVVVLGYTDNMLTARAFASGGGETIDPNQEFLALGAANLGSGLANGFPVSSSASRTALGRATGSRTQLHSVICVLAVVAVLAGGEGLLRHFPSAALGGLVVYAAGRLVDLGALRRLAHFRRRELYLALTATAGVLVVDLLYGVLIAVGLSLVEMLWRVARPHDAVLGRVPGLAGMHDIDDFPQARQIPGLVVYRYDSPLFFANADNFRRRAIEAVTAQAVPVRWFMLNAEANVEVDITALDALEALRSELTDRGIVVAMARVKRELYEDLEAYGLVDGIGRDRFYPTLPTAVAAYEEWLGGPTVSP